MPIDMVGALVGWLVQVGGQSGISLMSGSPDERQLRRAVEQAVDSVVDQADPASQKALRLGLRQCFSSPPQLRLDVAVSVGDGLRAAIAAQVALLDQMVNADTNRPFYQDVSADPEWLTVQVTEAVISALRHVVARGGLAELVHGMNASDVSAKLDALGLQISQLTAPAAARHTLPRDIASFTGRHADLERLKTVLTGTATRGGVVGIHAIDGMAGVGKTAFAVHAAHQFAPNFPDGQIFLSLKAHTRGQRPADPADALTTLLLTSGIPPLQIPPGIEARTALWRDHLANKRILLLLDDAVGSEQVRPLLPGTNNCLVLLTSRRRLTGLDEAVPISLDPLSSGEATELFVRVARRPDIPADDRGVGEVVRLCGYLPLAIRLIAARLRHRPTWTIADLVTALSVDHHRLTILQGEDVSVAAAFDLSYRDLDVEMRQLFRRLGLQFGADIDDYAVAALGDIDLHTARQFLDEFYDQHLIDEPARRRYRLHDLIRDHAQTLAAADQPIDCDAAIDRLLNYYLHTATTAGRYLAWNTPATSPVMGDAPAWAPEISTRQRATEWLGVERPNLHAASDYAALHAQFAYAIGIPFAMHGFLRTNGHWDEALILHRKAATTAQEIDDRAGEASSLCQLGAVQRLTGEYAAAKNSQNQAAKLYRALGDRPGEADAVTELGTVQCLTADYSAAATTLSQAFELYRELKQPLGQADALCQLGTVQLLTGEYGQAMATQTEALELYRNEGDLLGEADALRSLGEAQRASGHYADAGTNLTEALQLYSKLGSRPGRADALSCLGAVQKAVGDDRAAINTLRQALELYRELRNRRGEAEALNSLGDIVSTSSGAADSTNMTKQH